LCSRGWGGSPQEKRCLRTNVLFSFASVVVIENPSGEIYDECPTQRCYVRDL